jgi:hypothetical protein
MSQPKACHLDAVHDDASALHAKEETMAKMTLRDRIAQLPELPVDTFEAGGKLGYASNVPIVTLRPPKLPQPKPPKPSKTHHQKARAATRQYWVQATYPLIHCHDPATDLAVDGRLFTEQGTSESERPNANPAAILQRQRFYKLSSLNGRRLRSPLWCTVRSGPWLAVATEEESCQMGVKSMWQFELGQGSGVAFSWYGDWEEMPPYPLLTVFMNERAPYGLPVYKCCGDTYYCPTTMSCIPNGTKCPDHLTPA